MAATIILGVDPGARDTGLALVQGDKLLDHYVVRRSSKIGPKTAIDLDYLEAVIEAADRMNHTTPWIAEAVAIEAVNAPNPHLGMTNAGAAIATGAVVGAIAAWAQGDGGAEMVLLIDPAGHGSKPFAAYPPELIGSRETKGEGLLRHARSAYDVALAARWHYRTGRALARAGR